LAVIAFQAADIYQIQAFRHPASQCARLTVAWSIVFLVLVAAVFFAQLGGMYSRLWLSAYYGIGLFTLYATRLFVFGIVRRWTREGRLDRRAVVVGGGDPGEHLVTALDRQKDSDVRLVGVFDDRGDDRLVRRKSRPCGVARLRRHGRRADDDLTFRALADLNL
jgi:FlaA1/EpsC-like NDP-sugar epimerase